MTSRWPCKPCFPRREVRAWPSLALCASVLAGCSARGAEVDPMMVASVGAYLVVGMMWWSLLRLWKGG